MSDTAIGPNVKRLIAHKMAMIAVPPGGGFNSALTFLSSKQSIMSGAREAAEFVKAAIEAVRRAAEPNPWKDADDETIAAEILRIVDTRKKGK